MNKEGWLNTHNKTISFGGPLSKPENIFTCDVIKVPSYNKKVKEKESLGGGWYGETIETIRTIHNSFIVVKDNKCVGLITNPYCISKYKGIKTRVVPIDKNTDEEVLLFIKSIIV